ncbi:MAG: SDR family NAD(P)-dependent oxidoreductase [Boseongicola sp.]|nr:SDR family NAD(P)-dependent oxidoreductase [Boseongicola sp.]
MDLLGKTALVTGGTSGIGAATARVLAEAGANVVVAGRNEGAAKALCNEISREDRRATYALGDVADPDFAAPAVGVAERRFGGLHVLVNAAGAIVRGTAEGTSDEDWNRVLSVNVTGTFFMSRAAIPALRRSGGGSIVNLGSTVGLVGCPNLAAYCASKGAVVNLTRAMALDHAHESIRVNAVCPGAVDTPMLVSGRGDAVPDQVREANRASIPQRWLPGPIEIANAIAFLASDLSKHVTGTALPVDGGFTAK